MNKNSNTPPKLRLKLRHQTLRLLTTEQLLQVAGGIPTTFSAEPGQTCK